MDLFNELFGSKIADNIIFTPQKIALEMIEALPSEIWNRHTKFLDPCCKSGIYLHEIRNRLIECKDLIQAFPNEHDRLEHIDSNQLYGLSINENCLLLSARNVYGQLRTNSNIRYINNYIQKVKDKNTDYKKLIKEEFGDMQFDVIIGNPPYQDDNARAFYHHFINLGYESTSRIISMITLPSWEVAEVSAISDTRKKLVQNGHLKYIKDFTNASDIFEGVTIKGGVSYFLVDKNYSGLCEITQVNRESCNTVLTDVTNGEPIVRWVNFITIKDKVEKINTNKPYNSHRLRVLIPPFVVYDRQNVKDDTHTIKVINKVGSVRYDEEILWTNKVDDTFRILNKYKILISRQLGNAGKTTVDGSTKVLGIVEIIDKGVATGNSYFIGGVSESRQEIENTLKYIKSKFVRALILATISGISLSIGNFRLVPNQDFTHNSDIDWTQSIADIDQQLYKKYILTQEEIEYIEKTIKSMV